LVSNEGNARLVTSMPRVHVALVGIEKVIGTVEDYATLTQVLPRSATGQIMTVYTHMINGPRQPDEADGPEHVYVILVDNGRSDIYNTDYAEALACIGWVYPGPIGAVITPLLTGLENASPLPYASSLCGMCKAVCPVDIDIPRMLLDLRHDLVEMGEGGTIWNVGMKAWAWGTKSPTIFGLGGKAAALARNVMPQSLPGPLKGWTDYRRTPQFAPKSFRQLWQERQGDCDEQS
jgi:L-lactate dehydrogenase complex protein LldF